MSEPDLQAAIERIETSRQTHVDWRDYWLGIPDHADCDDCKATADIAGDLDRQVRVIAEYDNVLAVLRDVSAATTKARAEVDEENRRLTATNMDQRVIIQNLRDEIRSSRSEALREAATLAVSEDEGSFPWDHDYDRATVAAWLEELADKTLDNRPKSS